MGKLYGFCGRAAYAVLSPALRLQTRLMPRPRTRVLVTDGKGKVLLVRSWFGSQRWDLPGGGIQRGESAIAAAVREVEEETGVSLDIESLETLGEFGPKTSGLTHGIVVFYTRHPAGLVAPLKAYRHEVLEVGWFSLSQLPTPLNLFVIKTLSKLEEIEP